MKKPLIFSFLLFLAITALLGISAILSGDYDQTTGKILITTAAASFYSLIGISTVVHIGSKFDLLGKAGIVFCCLALLHAIYSTWIGFNESALLKNRFSFFLVGLAIGHACILLLIKPRNNGVSALMAIAIGSVVLNTSIAVGIVYFPEPVPFKLLIVIGIIATFATIAAPTLNFSIKKQLNN